MNLLTQLFSSASGSAGSKPKQTKSQSLANGGFKTSDDGRLIISDKAFRGRGKKTYDSADGTESDDSTVDTGHDLGGGVHPKRGMDDDSSDDEQQRVTSAKRNRNASDCISVRSGKTSTSMRIGIYRSLGSDLEDPKRRQSIAGSGCKAAKDKYNSKKPRGDMKLRGKLDPYAYIPLTRNTLNKR